MWPLISKKGKKVNPKDKDDSEDKIGDWKGDPKLRVNELYDPPKGLKMKSKRKRHYT